MGERDDGLTLEALAQRLESQTQRLEALERENTELRSKVDMLEGSDMPHGDVVAELRGSHRRQDKEAASEFDGVVSRRSLLSKAGAAAVAAMAAGTLVYPREARASHYADGIEVDFVRAHETSSNGTAVVAEAPSGTGVRASGSTGVEAYSRGVGSAAVRADRATTGFLQPIEGYGVTGSGAGANYAGVWGYNYRQGPGVKGIGVIGVWGTSSTEGQAGVYAEHKDTSGPGVVADAKGDSYAGVLGRNQDGIGVWGQASATGWEGVYGQHTGTSGYGVIGDGAGGAAGVLGRNNSGVGYEAFGVKGETNDAIGVKGIGRIGVVGESPAFDHGAVYGQHTGSMGYGVVGEGKGPKGAGVVGRNPGGYGGQFEGGKAQLKLKPGGSAGKPDTGAHVKGEISMDSAATLWVCTASGTPGTWRRVATTAN